MVTAHIVILLYTCVSIYSRWWTYTNTHTHIYIKHNLLPAIYYVRFSHLSVTNSDFPIGIIVSEILVYRIDDWRNDEKFFCAFFFFFFFWFPFRDGNPNKCEIELWKFICRPPRFGVNMKYRNYSKWFLG